MAVGLTLLGGLMIRSTQLSQDFADWWQHWLTGGVGLVLATLLARSHYRTLYDWRWWIYGGTCLSLVAVRFLGTEALGAQRWINIGGFHLQPSEFAKVGVIIVLAALLSDNPADRIGSILRTLGVLALPWFLVFIQPDLGTAMVFGAIAFGMFYWANARPGWLLLMLSPLVSAVLFEALRWAWPVWMGLVAWNAWKSLPWQRWGTALALGVNGLAGLLAGFLWEHGLHAYQRERLMLFLDPSKDPLGGGYHLIQSRIAIGSGGLWGKGLAQGTQTQLGFIPEQHTDFIFTAIGEELGFIGSIAVVAVFWLICWRLVVIAQTAKDDFGSLMAIGTLAMVLFQVVVNLAMTIGLGPVKGVPLPWLSYGRSALLTNFLALGIVEAVYRARYRVRR